jgi:hypothetical protein
MLKFAARFVETSLGIRIVKIASERRARLADLSPEVRDTVERAQPYTMTSPERLATLCMAVEHCVANRIPGDFVECGVWKGGSSMAAAWTYLRLGREDVDLFLFDTFEGMSEPTAKDIASGTGAMAAQLLASSDRNDEIWAYAAVDDVRRNLGYTGYPANRLHFIRGKVETTIPDQAPESIAVLRLDTDWYESTKHELTHLFPKLSPNGILIIDDYGAWEGAREAVDEYFKTMGIAPFLSRIDSTGRLYVKS